MPTFFSKESRSISDDLAVNLAKCSASVALVGVDVHSGSVGIGYTANNVVEDGGSAACDLNLNDLLVGDAHSVSGSGIEMDVSHSDNATFSDVNLTAGAYQLAAGGVFNSTGLTNGNVLKNRDTMN